MATTSRTTRRRGCSRCESSRPATPREPPRASRRCLRQARRCRRRARPGGRVSGVLRGRDRRAAVDWHGDQGEAPEDARRRRVGRGSSSPSLCACVLDVIRTRMQVGVLDNRVAGTPTYHNSVSRARTVERRVGERAPRRRRRFIHFGTLELLSERSSSGSAASTAFVGGAARLVAVTVLCPITTVKTRLEAGGAYRSVPEALVTIARQEGVLALWRGLWPAVFANVPFSALHLLLYRRFKEAAEARARRRRRSTSAPAARRRSSRRSPPTPLTCCARARSVRLQRRRAAAGPRPRVGRRAAAPAEAAAPDRAAVDAVRGAEAAAHAGFGIACFHVAFGLTRHTRLSAPRYHSLAPHMGLGGRGSPQTSETKRTSASETADPHR